MRTMMQVAIALVAMTGVASADAHAEKKAPPAKPTTKAPDKKPAPKMEMPKPAAELAAMAKGYVGTWRCKGESSNPDGSKASITAINRAKLDLDKFWIAESLDVKGSTPFKMTAYTTYDPAAKKWRRVTVDNWGSYMVGSSDGMKENKMTWNMDTVGAMGTGQFRDHVDATDAKAGVKLWGEVSMDKGKTWMKVYEMTCKK